MNSNKKLALEGVKNTILQWKDVLPECILDMVYTVHNQILILELEEKLQAKIPEYHDLLGGYADLSGNHVISLTKFQEGDKKEISRPDDGQQPVPGWYLRFSFSPGAYMFGGSYPKNSFDKFFQKLKSYGAHYCDTVNSTLYFSLDRDVERAQQVYKEYKFIYKMHYDMAKEEILASQIAQAQAELDRLKNGG